jgi:putative ABC transport system permease protein
MLVQLFLASFKANFGRSLFALAGIALGVALGLAVHVINQSAIGEMQQATRSLSGDADLTISAGRMSSGGFDESVFADVLADASVAQASAVLEIEATPLIAKSPRDTIKFIGIDIFRAARLQPGFVGELNDMNDRFAMLRPDSVLLNQAARAELGEEYSREFSVKTNLRDGENENTKKGVLNVIGKIELAQYKGPLAVMDIAGAQELFQQVGVLSRIDIRLMPGVRADDWRASFAPKLAAGLSISTPKQTDEQSAAVSRAYRINLTVLSLVALFTGGFLVFSTQSLSVVRRRGEFALLRTLGVTQGELTRTLLMEGGLIGLIGGTVGAAIGLSLAAFALVQFGADMGSGFFSRLAPTMQWNALSIIVFVSLGIGAGVAGAWLPARAIARDTPARALKAADGEGSNVQLPPLWAGLGLVAFSVVLLLIPPIDDIPWFAYAAIAALLLGVLSLTPRVSTAILSALPTPKRVVASLAKRHIENAPGPSAAGIAGVVASFSLMIAMLIMVVSFRSSLEQWLTGVLDLDLYARQGTGEANALNSATGAEFGAIEGVARADFLRFRSVVLDTTHPERPPVTLITRPLREDVYAALSVVKRVPEKTGMANIVISEAVADLYGFKLAETIKLPINGVDRPAYVAAIWRDYARSFGAIVIDRDQYSTWTGDTRINDIALKLKPNTDKAKVIAAIRALPGGERYEIADAADIRKLSLTVFDRSFAVTYALEIAAIFVGLAGISATFSAAAWARRREFGMLRHLGVTRREIAGLLASEGALLGSLGAVIGLALGVVIALILIFVVNRQSFHWSMELHMPWLTLAILSIVLVTLTAISATISGRYAMSRQVVTTVKDDA